MVSVAGAAVERRRRRGGAAVSVGGAVVGSTVKVAGKVVEKIDRRRRAPEHAAGTLNNTPR